MRQAQWLAVGLVLLILPLAGCPSPGNALDSVSGASATGGNSARGAQSIADGLTAQFPNCAEPIQAEAWRDAIFQMVNDARAQAGLNPVAQAQTLEDEATQYACEMIAFEFFAHENPITGSTLRDRAEVFGYEFVVIGENLAAGQQSPESAFSAWMNSPGHRENILDPRFTELGVGIRTGGPYGIYWVQEFGLPMPDDQGASLAPPPGQRDLP